MYLPIAAALLLAAGEPAPKIEKGTVAFAPLGDQKNVPEQYRLQRAPLRLRAGAERRLPVSGVEVLELRFPSPVTTPHKENNTVWAEYYRPIAAKGPVPGVIVLDITGGDQTLSRVIARHLAQNGVAALFVQMAYYGPRRPPGSKLRLLSTDLEHTFAAIRQTVLDLRRATAWLESRPEIDKRRLGIMGTSLGSFVATLTAEMEPKLGRLAVLLGGADFADGYWDHPKVIRYRKVLTAFGGKKEDIKRLLAPVDPITCVKNLAGRKVLIVAAKNDEIVPPRMAETLWRATGKQQIIWLNAGHYSAAIYLMQGLKKVTEHFRAEYAHINSPRHEIGYRARRLEDSPAGHGARTNRLGRKWTKRELAVRRVPAANDGNRLPDRRMPTRPAAWWCRRGSSRRFLYVGSLWRRSLYCRRISSPAPLSGDRSRTRT